MRRIISGHDYRATAAALFNVHPEKVTNAMLNRCKTLTFALRHATPLHELLIHERGTVEPPTAALEEWPDCPNCQQSATGRYWNGIHGCTRCGWSAGGTKNKRGGLYD